MTKRRNVSHFKLRSLCFVIVAVMNLAVNVLSQSSHPCGRADTSGYIMYRSSDGKQGIFSTPGYPKTNYPFNTKCQFRFRAQPGQVVWIEWHDFVLEEPLVRTNQCLHDYVEIKVTDYQNNQHVSGRYCGSRTPPDLKTMQATVDIIFQSSYTKHFQGFTGQYRFMDEKDVPPPESLVPANLPDRLRKQCGGVAKGVHSGTIISPGYPDSYPANIECNWLIRVERGKQIYIKLLDLELSESMECNTVALYIVDGYKHEVMLPGHHMTQIRKSFDKSTQVRFCGEGKYYLAEGEKSYMSDRNRLLVRLVTTQLPDSTMKANRHTYGKPIGFRMVWTEVTLEDSAEACSEFYCRGGKYCIDEGKNICAARKRYCIHKSLVCNGLPNCAESDESDEEDCYSAQIIGAGASIFAFLVLIIVVVIVFQKRRNRKHLSRMRMQRRQAGAITIDHSDSTTAAVQDTFSGPLSSQQSHEPLIQLSALPQNYYGYSHSEQGHIEGQEEDDVDRPFLVPNHIPPTAASSHIHQRFSNPGHTATPPLGADMVRQRRGPSLSVTRLPPVNIEESSFSENESTDEVWETRRKVKPSTVPMGLRVRSTKLVAQSSTESERSQPCTVEVHRQSSCDSLTRMDITMSSDTLRLNREMGSFGQRQSPPPVPPKPLRRPVFVPPPTYQQSQEPLEQNTSQGGKRKSVGFDLKSSSVDSHGRPLTIPETVIEERSPSPWHQLKPAMV